MADEEKSVRAVVLAGGKGTRLAPYSTVLPKPLMPIGDLPVLEILVRRLKKCGVRRITFSVGYLEQLIRAYFGDGSAWDVELEYSHEHEPLGTAGPLRLLDPTEDFLLVVNGDLLTDLDFREFLHFHANEAAAGTVAVYQRRIEIQFGVLETTPSGYVTEYIEKPDYDFLVSMGAYVFRPSVLDLIPDEGPFDLPDLIREIIREKLGAATFRHEGYWLDIGRVEDYQKAQEDWPDLISQMI